jgi:hypothetical protein
MTVNWDRRTHGIVATYGVGCRCASCREAKRRYALSNPSQWAHRIARTRMATWVHDNHPDVYQRFVDEALAEAKAARQ